MSSSSTCAPEGDYQEFPLAWESDDNPVWPYVPLTNSGHRSSLLFELSVTDIAYESLYSYNPNDEDDCDGLCLENPVQIGTFSAHAVGTMWNPPSALQTLDMERPEDCVYGGNPNDPCADCQKEISSEQITADGYSPNLNGGFFLSGENGDPWWGGDDETPGGTFTMDDWWVNCEECALETTTCNDIAIGGMRMTAIYNRHDNTFSVWAWLEVSEGLEDECAFGDGYNFANNDPPCLVVDVAASMPLYFYIQNSYIDLMGGSHNYQYRLQFNLNLTYVDQKFDEMNKIPSILYVIDL